MRGVVLLVLVLGCSSELVPVRSAECVRGEPCFYADDAGAALGVRSCELADGGGSLGFCVPCLPGSVQVCSGCVTGSLRTNLPGGQRCELVGDRPTWGACRCGLVP